MRKLNAYLVYLAMEAMVALIFSMIFTASAVYQVTTAQLSALQLVLVGTTLETAVFLFEVPTGVVADIYSRRLSIIIGMFLIGVGFIVEGSFPFFLPILLAQVLWGVGYTFTSGATQAWITDEIGEVQAGRAFLRGSQVGNLAALFGIAAGMFLGNISVSIPIQLGGLLLIILGLFLILLMPETGFNPLPREDRNSWQSMAHTFRQGLTMVRRRPALLTILSIGLVYGLYSEGYDRLWAKHILDNFAFPALYQLQPVVWFGLIRAAEMLFSAGAAEIARRKIDTANHMSVARALLFVTVVLLAGLIVFALAPTLAVAIAAVLLIDMARSVISPVYTAWVNQRLDSQVRATVLSMSSQVDAIGQIAGGPFVGIIGSAVSVRAALLASSAILSPALALYSRILRRGTQDLPAPIEGS